MLNQCTLYVSCLSKEAQVYILWNIETYVTLILNRLIKLLINYLEYIFKIHSFTCRLVAIKEIILDPKKKNRTKEAVLKEARYCTMHIFK